MVLHFFDRKEMEKKTLRPESHSHNNIKLFDLRRVNSLRSNNTRPCCCLTDIIGSFDKGQK